MHPGVAGLQAVLAALCARCDLANRIEMRANRFHDAPYPSGKKGLLGTRHCAVLLNGSASFVLAAHVARAAYVALAIRPFRILTLRVRSNGLERRIRRSRELDGDRVAGADLATDEDDGHHAGLANQRAARVAVEDRRH